MSPNLSVQTINRETSLSNALESLIDQANRHQDNERMLKLYAHRFALEPGYWLDITDCHSIEQNLTQLIKQYGDYLPVLIEDFNVQCQHMGWTNVAEKTNRIVASFFDRLENHKGQVGLLSLLDKIYFAHRLIEEIHDHIMCHTGQPKTTWNMTMANLLVHQLLGPEYSSRLDQSVIELAEKILSDAPKPNFTERKKGPNVVWPCFCERYGLNLVF
jgi:hypothetical protein